MDQYHPNQLHNFKSSSRVSECGRWMCILLCLVGSVAMLGGLHRFYTGRYFSGFLMLCTLGGLFVWSLIDFLFILFGAFKDGDEKYVSNWWVE